MLTKSGLEGFRVLVTGASSGIGYAIAERLAASGCVVGLHHRRPHSEMAATVEALSAEAGKAVPIMGDLRIASERDSIVPRFVEVAGGIDALVNNAGAVKDYVDFRDLDIASWEETISVNATAPFALSKAAWPFFERNGGGRIINISSAAVGYGGGPKGVHYTAAKAALESMTKSMSKAGAVQNVLVNTVRCGVVETSMHEKIDGYDAVKFRDRVAKIPLGRAGKPSEVAELVAFLLSRHGAFITGETISISGGD